MNIIQEYLARSQEIIGERTEEEIRYDDEVIKELQKWRDIRKAIAKANRKYPKEALQVAESDMTDVAAYYEYLMQHEEIMRKLR